MPTFDKSSPELVARFNATLERHAAGDVVLRKMFGYPCAWVNGNMATGLFAEQWWVNVSDPDRETLLRMPGGKPFEVMPGKAMGRNVTLPPDVLASEASVNAWIGRSLDYTRTLPAKRR
jgi:hypothetical protein